VLAAGAAPGRSASTAQLPGEPASSAYVGPLYGSLRDIFVSSRSVGRELPSCVYLPPDDGHAGRRYPVLYMLHGAGGSLEEWPAYGLVDAVDRLIVAHEIRPMIVVMPQGDTGYWVNHVDGPRWGDYAAYDVVPAIDATFDTLPYARSRVVSLVSTADTRSRRPPGSTWAKTIPGYRGPCSFMRPWRRVASPMRGTS
jgi:enterochelin esterase family protein